ncbi:protein containing hemopexin repeats [Pedobacter sp. BAL39]|uniref:alkaline phosphatase family protein n=1 Tax=Pedobacter sp. BAL39 TaxID=391596 RepID=UPI0001559CD5|nr:alkaline phosphatase family protein [Pedobacter sp. BAL39]EDM37009.1 protein containing hemopexin repeats [Pedobacter sp. BAL39]
MAIKAITLIVTVFFSVTLSSRLCAQQRQRKVVYIITDGISADVMENQDLPNLKKIIQAGSYTRMHVGGDKGTYNETPTISAVGYNSLLTGTWVNKHNVPDNAIKAPNYNYQNIFRLFKDQYPDKKTAIFSSWTDNRTKLLGHNLPAAGNLKVDEYFDGYELDTARFRHDKKSDYMHQIDEQVVRDAVTSIKTQAPDLSWVYLEYTDDMGHMYGDSPEFYKAIAMMDVQVGKIWDAIQYREKQFKEDWLIVITTDHGRDEKSGRGHGGQSDRQRSTWVICNDGRLNTYGQYFDLGIVDIMPTIAHHLNVKLPVAVAQEQDGIPFFGPVAVAGLKVNHISDHLDISWKALDKKGKVKIWLATTNLFKEGGKDHYILLAETAAGQQHYLADITKYPSSFYKVVLESELNTVNKWVILK